MGQPSIPALHAVSDRSVDMARKLADKKTLTHEGWLELRKSSIGGSEAGALVGMNPYSSAITVYAQKKGLVKDVQTSEAMRLGTDLEAYVAQRYMEQTGNKVRVDNFMYMSDDYDFITANIDRQITGQNGGVECKVMGSGASKYNFEAGEIPEQYYCQCQHYCYVMGWDFVDLAVLVLQRGIEVVRIVRNEDFIRTLIKAEVDFWENNILKEQMPSVDGSEASIETLKELYPKERKDTEITISGLDQMVADYIAASEMEKHYKEVAGRIKGQICTKLGTNAYGLGAKYGVSWKSQTKANISPSKLKAKYPAIYAELVEVSEYRVFRTKTMKKKEK